ncbi:MAG: FkbM family methyltransferase [Pseudolabrys sp.]|nr:FkbM family methyltransferase [Pseudolabrys sp.]
MKTLQKIFLARMAQRPILMARALIGKGPVLETRRGGLNWRLDLREGIDFSIFLLGAFERDTVQWYRKQIRPGDTVLDIGANIGAHTLPMADAVGPSGRIIAVEPTEYAFAKLTANLGLNVGIINRVTPIQAFLTDGSEKELPASIYSSWPLEEDEDLHAQHHGRMQTTAGAKATTVNDLLAQQDVTAVNLVKLDVDGFEGQVLGGASLLFSKFRPVFVMELAPYHLAEHGTSLSKLLDIFKKADYEFRGLNSNEVIPMDEGYLQTEIPPGSGWNITARPIERSTGAAG